MIEKGVSPPPKFALARALSDLNAYLTQLDIWFRTLRDNFARVQTYSVSLTPSSVAANSTAEQSFVVTGLGVGDIVTVNKPTHTSGIGIVGARVSAADTLRITFVNITGGPITPATETYLVSAIRR